MGAIKKLLMGALTVPKKTSQPTRRKVYSGDPINPQKIDVQSTISEILHTPVSPLTSINVEKLKEITDPVCILEIAKLLRSNVVVCD